MAEFYEGTSWDEPEKLKEIFVGRSIVSVTDKTMTLDNGDVLTISGNEGCGGCGNGWYDITHLAAFPNVITNVEAKPESDDYDDGNVRLFVYSEGLSAEVITAEGYDNGYYGTGFWIAVNHKEN